MLSSPWLIVAVVCILSLAIYATVLWRRVWQAEQQCKQALAAQKLQRHGDLIVLANGFLSGQMPWAEGCIRIKVILDHYSSAMAMHPDYLVLQNVFSATEHIPTHDAWRDLSNEQKKPFAQLLKDLELQYKEESVRAVKQLLNQLKG